MGLDCPSLPKTKTTDAPAFLVGDRETERASIGDPGHGCRRDRDYELN